MSFKEWPRNVAVGGMAVPSRESADCAVCGDRLWFGTDGNGNLVEQCPHCDWGHPAPVRAAVPVVSCKHGKPTDQRCDACVAERHRHDDTVRAGVARWLQARARSEANKRGWDTRRTKGEA